MRQSRICPLSFDGAIYLLLVGYADFNEAHTFIDNDLRASRRRRGRRCLERAISKLRGLPAAHADIHILQWLGPIDDTEWNRLYYGRSRADQLLEAEKASKVGAS